jgi:SET domain-containing protein
MGQSKSLFKKKKKGKRTKKISKRSTKKVIKTKRKRRGWDPNFKANPTTIVGRKIMDNPADYDLEVKKSKIHGYGLFTKRSFKKNETIVPYNHLKSQVMKWDTFVKKHGDDFRFTYSLRAFGNGKIINQKKYQNLISFTNDNRPYHNAYLAKRTMKARRDIRSGEELTLSYPHYNPRD